MKPTYRCSSLPRIFGCNGSISVVPLVDERAGDEGWEGTSIHHAIASRAITELGAVGPEGGLPSPDVPEGYEIPLASRWIIEWGMRHLRETVPAGWSLQVEVELSYEFDTFILVGHQDWLAMSPDGSEAIGGDWKTGQKVVEPALTNEQMFGYGVENVLAWPELRKLTIQLCQPRADEESGFERVSEFTLEGDILARAPAVLDQRMRAAQANNMELNTGPTQCTYCIGCSCPAIRELLKMKMLMTTEMLAEIKRTPDDAMLADFFVDAKVLEKPIEDARDMVIERLKANGYMDAGCGNRLTLKTQGGKFKVIDPVGAWNAVNEIVPTDRMPEVVSYSKTALVDVIADVRGIPKKSEKKECGESVFKGYIATFMVQGEKNLVVIS
jgi:hypothetical protein